jgi:hypothetical protein
MNIGKEMVDGFYTAKFRTHGEVEGAGVVLMRGGKLLGGDNSYKYVGNYVECEGEMKVTVRADRFAPGISVFGDFDKLELTFIATIIDNGVKFTGTLVDSLDQKLEVVLERQPENI